MKLNLYKMLQGICEELGSKKIKLKVVSEDPVTEKNQTSCIIYPYFNEATIRINEIEIEEISDNLYIRKYDLSYAVLGVLLHEIAHYRQYKKAMKKRWFKVIRYRYGRVRRHQYYEDLADRYAHFCLKIIVRNVHNGKVYLPSDK